MKPYANQGTGAVMIPAVAWAATIAKTGCGILLIAGLWPRWVSLVSAVPLAIFGPAMAISLGQIANGLLGLSASSAAASWRCMGGGMTYDKLQITT